MKYNIELTSEEIQVIQECINFVADGNVSFEALEGYIDEDIDCWKIKKSLEEKFK